MKKFSIPDDVKFIIETLTKNGFEAYIVGGCVRDLLMGCVPIDWDITTSATPLEIKKYFKHTVDTGILHGTVTVVLNKNNYEVTTYRIDGEYNDNRHPENVTYTKELCEDLLRRDFTINAVAYNDIDGIVDPFNGISDIDAKVIRGVGVAELRFKEDALRMLRALRFAAKLGFEIEKGTYTALTENAHLIKNISIERIRDELLKLLMSDRPEYISLFLKSGVAKHVDLALYEYLAENMAQITETLPQSKKDLPIRLCLLFLKMDGAVLQNTLKFFRLDNSTIKEVLLLNKWVLTEIKNDFYEIRKMLSCVGTDAFEKIILMRKISALTNGLEVDGIMEKYNEIIKNGDCFSLKQLKINGSVLKGIGITNGVMIGKTLEVLLDHVMKNPEKNTENELLLIAKQNCMKSL